jgi:hypothetical protein
MKSFVLKTEIKALEVLFRIGIHNHVLNVTVSPEIEPDTLIDLALQVVGLLRVDQYHHTLVCKVVSVNVYYEGLRQGNKVLIPGNNTVPFFNSGILIASWVDHDSMALNTVVGDAQRALKQVKFTISETTPA